MTLWHMSRYTKAKARYERAVKAHRGQDLAWRKLRKAMANRLKAGA